MARWKKIVAVISHSPCWHTVCVLRGRGAHVRLGWAGRTWRYYWSVLGILDNNEMKIHLHLKSHFILRVALRRTRGGSKRFQIPWAGASFWFWPQIFGLSVTGAHPSEWPPLRALPLVTDWPLDWVWSIDLFSWQIKMATLSDRKFIWFVPNKFHFNIFHHIALPTPYCLVATFICLKGRVVQGWLQKRRQEMSAFSLLLQANEKEGCALDMPTNRHGPQDLGTLWSMIYQEVCQGWDAKDIKGTVTALKRPEPMWIRGPSKARRADGVE
jgi:hypothetical protein